MNVKAPFSKVKWNKINVDSSMQIKELLLSLGWEPTEWNTKRVGKGVVRMSPKLTEDSYSSLPEGLGQSIALYNTLKHRRNVLENKKDPYGKGLLSRIRADGRVPAEANTLGTNTSRYAHSGSICNVPGVYAVYGPPMREVYTTPHGSWMIGCDLDQIEMRVAAHYAYIYDGGKLADQVMHGDFHQDVADNVYGCSRNDGKSVSYGILYGCGVGKVASMLGCSQRKASMILKNFWLYNEGLGILKDKLEEQFKSKGYIKAIDGRRINIREKYRLLNTLMQATAAVIFKRWLINVRENVSGIEQLIAYHDEGEWEYEGSEYGAWKKGQRIKREIERTGKQYRLRVPISGTWKVGSTWLDVH